MTATKLTKELIEKFIPPRENNSRKGDNGKVLVVGGSYIYHGAPVLSSLAALRSGSDLVYTCVPKINAFSTRSISPDLIVIPMADSKLTRGTVNKMLGQIPVDIDSAAIGMGLAIQDIEAIKLLVKSLLDRNVRVSLDASSLVKEIPQAQPKQNYHSKIVFWSIFFLGAFIACFSYIPMVDAAKNVYPYFPIRFLLKDKYESDKKIKNLKSPILIMHGEADKIVPFWMGKKMYELANEPKYSYFSEKDNHMMEYNKKMIVVLKEFLKSLN